MKRVFLLATLAITGIASLAQPAGRPALENDATRRTMEMGLGWNLGNQLDAYEEDPGSRHYLIPDERIWGNPKATAEALRKVRAAGFTTIRIPVTWLRKIGPAPDYKIDPDWMARVTEVVGYAHDAGFRNVIVDMHHDEDHDDGHWQNLKGASVLDSFRESEMVNEQVKKDVMRLMEALPDSQREVVYMRFFQQMSFKEIAEETGVSINTSLGRMRYALINLRKLTRQHHVNLNLE